MAKRTYRDALGYKRKRRKRGTPEFATIEEYTAWKRQKKVQRTRANPINRAVEPVPEGIKHLEQIVRRLDELLDPQDNKEDGDGGGI